MTYLLVTRAAAAILQQEGLQCSLEIRDLEDPSLISVVVDDEHIATVERVLGQGILHYSSNPYNKFVPKKPTETVVA